jgi:pimeloyl-ACP methyl ester carboxylesterase
MGSAPVLVATPIHPESARYAASLVFLPGLWAGPGVWQGPASYLAHRGWEGYVLDLRQVRGGLAARAAAVAEYARGLPKPPVLVGHDAGAVVAFAAAVRGPIAAVVGLAPLVPGTAPARALSRHWSLLPKLLWRQPVPPPTASIAALALGGLPPGVQRNVLRDLGPEDVSAVLDVARGRLDPPSLGPLPALVVSGDQDPLLGGADAAALARTIGAEHHLVAGAGHWLLAGSGWEPCVGIVHRWLVQRLGDSLLELYPEAMAERDEPH